MPKRPRGKRYFPVQGGGQYTNDWGGARPGGRRHQGTDIFAPRGTPVIAVEDGIITKMGPSEIGGNRIWLNGRWYYAHLDHFAAGMRVGKRVKAGTVLGFVGNTGDARGTPTHLHFGYDPQQSSGKHWANPYKLLRSLEIGGGVDPTTGAPQTAPDPNLEPQGGSQPPPNTQEPVDLAPQMPDPTTPPQPEVAGIGLPGSASPQTGRQFDYVQTWEMLSALPMASPETLRMAERARRTRG